MAPAGAGTWDTRTLPSHSPSGMGGWPMKLTGSPGKHLGWHLVLAALRADGVPTLSPVAGAAPAPLACRAAELSSALGRMSQDPDQATFQKCSQVLLQPG